MNRFLVNISSNKGQKKDYFMLWNRNKCRVRQMSSQCATLLNNLWAPPWMTPRSRSNPLTVLLELLYWAIKSLWPMICYILLMHIITEQQSFIPHTYSCTIHYIAKILIWDFNNVLRRKINLYLLDIIAIILSEWEKMQ